MKTFFKSVYGKDTETIKKFIIDNKDNFTFYNRILIKHKYVYLAGTILQVKYKNKTILILGYNGTASVFLFKTEYNLNIEVYFKVLKENNRQYFDMDLLLKNTEEISMSIDFMKFMVFSIKNTFITIPKEMVIIKNYHLCLEEKLLTYQNIKFYKPSKNIFNSLIYYLDKKMEVTINHNTILLKEYKFVKENTDILIYKDDELIYKTDNENLLHYKIISDLYIDLFYGFYKKYKINIKEISKIFNVTNINNHIIEYFYNTDKTSLQIKPFKININFNNSEETLINTITFYTTDLYFFYEISYKDNNTLNLYDSDKQVNNLYNVLYAEKFDFNIFTDSIDYFLEKSEYLFSYYK